MTLTRRLHLLIVLPLLVVTLAVAAITTRALSTNAAVLEEALRTEAQANRAWSLLLVQEDTSKAILIDPDRLADYSAPKLAAYDEHQALLQTLRQETKDPQARAGLAELARIDSETLRPLDTRILELLFEDPAAARRLYFEQYEPHHARYEAGIRKLVEDARAAVAYETEASRARDHASLAKILSVLIGSIAIIAVVIQILGQRVQRGQEQLRSLLRGMDEGMFYFDQQGAISEQRSDALAELLPGSEQVQTLADFYERFAQVQRENVEACLRLLWAPEDDGFYSPFEATTTLLPGEIVLPDQHIVRLRYQAGMDSAGKLVRVYVNARDVTLELQTEREARLQQERADRIGIAAAGPEGFLAFQKEMDGLFAELEHAASQELPPLELLARHLHTIKGSSGTSAFRSTASRAHALEDKLLESGPDESFQAALREAREQWSLEARDVRQVLGLDQTTDMRRVSVRKLLTLAAEVRQRRDEILLERVNDLERRPIAEQLERHRRYVLDLLARRELPPAEVVFEEGSAELNVLEVQLVDGILPHLLRNAVDHGLESTFERERAGKAPICKLTIGCRREGGHILWTITDDGRGIPGDELARKMVANGKWDAQRAASATWQEKIGLALLSGLSSAAQVSETSGRGVGLDAVYKHVSALGGEMTLRSTPGRGTTITLSIPSSPASTNSRAA
jgi:HPt (histidine-containing phosphotransfer) domain-containing protein